jgi:transcriptional regulator with XRE-family HTH domain
MFVNSSRTVSTRKNVSRTDRCQVVLSPERSDVDLLDTVGSRLRAARLAAYERIGRQISQAELAELMDLTRSAISGYEADVYTPSVAMVEALAKQLGVTAAWLAYGQEPRYPPATKPKPAEQSAGPYELEPTSTPKKKTTRPKKA